MSGIFSNIRSLAADAKASTVAPTIARNGSAVEDAKAKPQASDAQKSNNVNDAVDKTNSNSLNLIKGAKTESETMKLVAERVEAFIPTGEDNTKLSIEKDETTGQFIYRALDKESGEIVHQFPPEDILRVLRAKRKAEGLVIDKKA